MDFNQQNSVKISNGWQPHPRAFLRKQERGWGWLVAGEAAYSMGPQILTSFEKENEMKTTRMLLIVVLALVVGLPAGVANADFTFGTPVNLGPTINSSSNDVVPTISGDGLELYFTSDRPGGEGGNDIWVTTRETTADDWGTPVNLGPTVNSSSGENSPSISADGLKLYFSDFGGPRPGGVGGVDIWFTTRPTKDNEWGPPVNLGSTVNTGGRDGGPSISADGLALFLYSNRSGGYGSNDIWVTTRATTNNSWAEPANLGLTVCTSGNDCCPSISADGLTLFFASNRSGGSGGNDLWATTRRTRADPWEPPVNLGSTVNSSSVEDGASISADGSTLFFMSNRPGGVGSYDLWQAPVIPIVDFNGDGIVDSADMCIMVDHWGENYPLCDIGPMPWGDGIVDVQDLIVLAEHLLTYPGAVAYWKLDEPEGFIAHDSAGNNDGTCHGEPLWQPTAGQIDGALAFDGIDDYVSTLFILNPAEGPFSVFTWIKGGAPGQVIVSQTGGTNWLLADPSEGKLRTSLLCPAGGRSAPQPLISEFIITDDNWHRIGFVWDGSNRMLYVDDVQVATDTQDSLEGSAGGLFIGAGKALEPGSFFSGLIDDVRIYNRVVSP